MSLDRWAVVAHKNNSNYSTITTSYRCASAPLTSASMSNMTPTLWPLMLPLSHCQKTTLSSIQVEESILKDQP